MRLTYSTQSDAQTRADSIHAQLQVVDADYAASAAANQTMRWTIPYQDKDDAGNLLSTNWFVTVSDRCQLVLTDAEQTAAGFPAPGP
jgi:hypothetical protein